MTNVLIGLWLLLIILIAAAFLAYYFFPAAFPVFRRHAHLPNQVIKRDWVPTGRIDFASSITGVRSNPEDYDQPAEFKLLVEEVGLWRASQEMKIWRCNGGLLT